MDNEGGRTQSSVKLHMNLGCCLPTTLGSFILYSDNQSKQNKKEDKEKKPKLKWEFLSLSGYNSFVHVYIKDNIGCICAQSVSCVWLCNPMDCSLLGSSVHGIFQARILQWVAISYSRGSSQRRDRTCISWVSSNGRQILLTLSHLRSPNYGLPINNIPGSTLCYNALSKAVYTPVQEERNMVKQQTF